MDDQTARQLRQDVQELNKSITRLNRNIEGEGGLFGSAGLQDTLKSLKEEIKQM